MADIRQFTIRVNGRARRVSATPDMPLLWVLRQELGLPGTKFGCGVALCGACTVHVDGAPQRACQLAVGDVGSAGVTTIEGMKGDALFERLRKAWLDIDVMQCGYCQSGQIMSAHALLRENPSPSNDEIDAAMEGNICRCATYSRIREAIGNVAAMQGGAK